MSAHDSKNRGSAEGRCILRSRINSCVARIAYHEVIWHAQLGSLIATIYYSRCVAQLGRARRSGRRSRRFESCRTESFMSYSLNYSILTLNCRNDNIINEKGVTDRRLPLKIVISFKKVTAISWHEGSYFFVFMRAFRLLACELFLPSS